MREITDHYVNGSQDPTRVFALDEPDHAKGGGACHEYVVTYRGASEVELTTVDGTADKPCDHRPILGEVYFQHGPVAECGLNGVQNEHLLVVIADRLRCFQAGPFACHANAAALEAVDAALHALKGRTAGRQERGVEGRNQS